MPISGEAVRAYADYRARWANWMIVDIMEWFNRHTNTSGKPPEGVPHVPTKADASKMRVV